MHHDLTIIPPRSGASCILKKGQRLRVVDLEGEQVADFICFNLHDKAEYLSSGRTIDYAETIFLTQGHPLYSNRSVIMADIVEDTVGRHDFLLTPCSADTFRIIYGHEQPHRGCFGNLCAALEEYGIVPDAIPTTFNLFMNVAVDGTTGKVDVLPPKSRAGDYIVIEARMDLLVGLTACSAEMSNNYAFKPIGYRIEG
ncbi:urea carboxylase-associated family protein [Hymenobacter weizhouensis]|uniref:urea carboxylase-associated family protein n=1 Tax=Hymenobacter sp. YIM 151500-1 TaxID=2987689 RepID=UPI002227C311|nr:urea carboxylase-associated family protein [Hymenobacter sp. YIM 151500-1]UYZ62459.1 urea carboxylase-associated family protein [Hymenobacter sp. YIM 151500-1]